MHFDLLSWCNTVMSCEQMGFLGCDVDQCAPPNVEGIVFFKPASTTAATVSNPSPPVEGAAAPPRHRRRHHNASAAAAPSVFSSTAAPTNVATPPSEVAPPTESAPSSPEPAKAAPPPDNAEASSTKRTRPSKLAELIDAIAEGSTESQLATITDPDLRERRRLAMRAAVGSDSLELVGAAGLSDALHSMKFNPICLLSSYRQNRQVGGRRASGEGSFEGRGFILSSGYHSRDCMISLFE